MSGSQLLLEEVSKTFGSGTAAVPVVAGLKLEIQPGEIVSLVGPSGCGKSTLLRLISGLDREHGGVLKVGGVPVTSPSRATGLMFQEPRLLPWRNVAANVAFGAKPGRSRAEVNGLVAELLEQVGMSGSEKLLPRQLSGGMAQRVALARALAGEPGLLLLDEPFSALDAFTRMRLQDLLLAVWQRYRPTMLLVTHDVDEALYLSDRVVVLSDRPARVQEIIEVGVARPRDRNNPDLLRLRADLLVELHLAGSASVASSTRTT